MRRKPMPFYFWFLLGAVLAAAFWFLLREIDTPRKIPSQQRMEAQRDSWRHYQEQGR